MSAQSRTPCPPRAPVTSQPHTHVRQTLEQRCSDARDSAWCFQRLAFSSEWSAGIPHATCNDMRRVVSEPAHQVEEQWDQDRNKKKSFHLSHNVQEAVIIGR